MGVCLSSQTWALKVCRRYRRLSQTNFGRRFSPIEVTMRARRMFSKTDPRIRVRITRCQCLLVHLLWTGSTKHQHILTRLEHLGDSVLSLVVTGLVREVFPYLRVGPSTKIRALVVGNPTLASISVKYRLPERLRMHPAQAITLRASINIQADLFEAFVGGLYLDQGLESAKTWLHPLFRPYIIESYRQVRVQHGLSPDPPGPQAHPRRRSSSSASSSDSAAPTWSLPAASRMTASIGHLSLFNQHLQQQGKGIEWVWSDSQGQGTRTTPIWVVRAMVDNECLGRGRGSTKKAAKNEAAKEGLRKMGVYVPYVHFLCAMVVLTEDGYLQVQFA
ncbi:hypothetical protein AcV7_003424 [Taiwanofungus camphoratus]|nr:hypothetical protein AcV7_003424 [Antrodia cinnamomea]